MNRFQRFVIKWWYPLSIFPFFCLFMTPGMTFVAFVSFIFTSGIAARPQCERLISYAFSPDNISSELNHTRLKSSATKRKLTKTRNEQI